MAPIIGMNGFSVSQAVFPIDDERNFRGSQIYGFVKIWVLWA
jgi:hypothetical protein